MTTTPTPITSPSAAPSPVAARPLTIDDTLRFVHLRTNLFIGPKPVREPFATIAYTRVSSEREPLVAYGVSIVSEDDMPSYAKGRAIAQARLNERLKDLSKPVNTLAGVTTPVNFLRATAYFFANPPTTVSALRRQRGQVYRFGLGFFFGRR